MAIQLWCLFPEGEEDAYQAVFSSKRPSSITRCARVVFDPEDIYRCGEEDCYVVTGGGPLQSLQIFEPPVVTDQMLLAMLFAMVNLKLGAERLQRNESVALDQVPL
jgi:hypothetical protein